MKKLITLLMTLLVAGCGGRPTADWLGQLRSTSAVERLHAIDALSDRRGEQALVVPALTEALGDKEVFVRQAAVRALTRLGSDAQASLPALRTLERDPDRRVRRLVVEALQKIGGAAGTKVPTG